MPGNWIKVTVGTNAILGLPKNKGRTWIVIVNNSTNTVEWDHSASLTYGQGGPIPAGSGLSLAETEQDDTHEPIYLIANTSGNDVRLYETTGVGSLATLLREFR